MHSDFSSNNFLILVGQANTGNGGPLFTDSPGAERDDAVGTNYVCLGCGDGTDSVATVLGVLAESTRGALSATSAYAYRGLMFKPTFNSTQKKHIARDRLCIRRVLVESSTALHEEASRKALVPK